ncbi:MAG: permease [Candidatus Rokubacteria bacterium]|nr:permease [Candidatus Rokubacteria bacterium]MBI2555168.1 permease [Candidatus Rokubacteria bacterium]
MRAVLAETIGWGWAYVQHVVVMFYWAWAPGILAVAALSARYRPDLREITLKRQSDAAGVLAAIGWGMTSGAGRRASLAAAARLRAQGVPDRVVLAYLVASHQLGLFVLLLFTLLIGLEFGLGLFFGGLAMAGLLCLFAPVLGSGRSGPARPETDGEEEMARPGWRGLLCSRRSGDAIPREVGRPLRQMAGSLLGGLILGALILTVDNNGYWFLPKWLGGEGVGPALAGAFLASLLSVALFLAPGGNLFVASSIWKTWTLTNPGVLAFVLMSLVNPLTVRVLLRQYGRRQGWLLVLATYLAAALSGLAVASLFTVVGLEVTHVPWLRDLVDRIILALPFTMLGAPGGGMEGM